MSAEPSTPEPRPARPFIPTAPALAALAALEQGFGARAPFVLLSGREGMGKRTLVREALTRLDGRAWGARCPLPAPAPEELANALISAFGGRELPGKPAIAVRERLLETLANVTAAGRVAVLVVHDAHALTPAHLTALARVAADASGRQCPMEVWLLGTPALEQAVNHDSLAQLREQIAAHVKPAPLSPIDTRQFLQLRPTAQGVPSTGIFSRKAARDLHAATGGVPGLVEWLAQEASARAFRSSATTVSPEHVRAAASMMRSGRVIQSPSTANTPRPVPARPVRAHLVRPAAQPGTPGAPEPAPRPATPASGTPRPAASAPASADATPRPAPAPRNVTPPQGTPRPAAAQQATPANGTPRPAPAPPRANTPAQGTPRPAAPANTVPAAASAPRPQAPALSAPRQVVRPAEDPAVSAARKLSPPPGTTIAPRPAIVDASHAPPAASADVKSDPRVQEWLQRFGGAGSVSVGANYVKPLTAAELMDDASGGSGGEESVLRHGHKGPLVLPKARGPVLGRRAPRVSVSTIVAVIACVALVVVLAQRNTGAARPAATAAPASAPVAAPPADATPHASAEELAAARAKRAARRAEAAIAGKLRYSVIAGAFSDRNMARAEEDHLSRLVQHRVWISSTVVAGERTYRLMLGSFETREAAEAAAESLLQHGLLRDANVVKLPAPAPR